MSPFAVDKRDIQFCLFEYLKLEDLCKLENYSEFNREMFEMVLDECIKFSTDVLAPLNIVLDREGVGYENGKVTTPEENHVAFKKFYEGGWGAPAGNPEYGGQGLPLLLSTSVTEIMGQASTAFLMTPGLTRAAARVIESSGKDELKSIYIENMFAGKWAGTMCLTEAAAGSAVGDLKTKAKPEGDHYLIEGEKIFISSGDQDLTENIVHLVLARIEGAPKGMKGVSLFLVPKFRVNPDGTVGEYNQVTCGGIEHKMGIHGSPTCTMIFGADGPCHGWLIGEENRGIRYMFQMMNEARIGVGLQGLSTASGSYQEALQYAKERIQGVDILDMKNVDAPRVAIIKHPDVRRNLLTMKAYVEGMRAMIYFAARCADLALNGGDDDTRTKYHNMLELMTPIVKAYCSDRGFEMTAIGVQVFGGYGYTQEFPQEQYCRDCKIASIYEGTNGIQALDLLGRKVAGKGAMAFMTFLNHLNDFINDNREHPFAGSNVKKLEQGRDTLSQVVMHFQKVGAEGDMYYPILHATPFLDMFGTIVMAYFLVDMAIVAEEKLGLIFEKAGASSDEDKLRVVDENPEAKYYAGKISSMRFFLDSELPHAHAIADSIRSGDRSPLEVNF